MKAAILKAGPQVMIREKIEMELIFLILSGVILLLAAGLFLSRLKLSNSGVVVQGEVLRTVNKLMPGADDANDKSEHLEIGYVAPNGTRQTMIEQNSLMCFFYKSGDKVDLVIDPHNYHRVIVRNVVAVYLAPFALFILGLVSLYIVFATN